MHNIHMIASIACTGHLNTNTEFDQVPSLSDKGNVLMSTWPSTLGMLESLQAQFGHGRSIGSGMRCFLGLKMGMSDPAQFICGA